MPDVIEQLENWVKGHFEKKCNCKCLDDNPLIALVERISVLHVWQHLKLARF